MIIIAGYLEVDPAERDRYVRECIPVVESARSAAGCLDFAITTDSASPGSVRIFERWSSEAELLDFRGSGSSDEQNAQILDADVKRYEISAVGDP